MQRMRASRSDQLLFQHPRRLLAPLMVLLATAWLRSRGPAALPSATLVMETGVAVETGFALSPLDWLPFVQVRWEWLQPRGAEVEVVRRDGLLCERVRLPERGRFTQVQRRISVSDAFGLCRISSRLGHEMMVDVLPR